MNRTRSHETTVQDATKRVMDPAFDKIKALGHAMADASLASGHSKVAPAPGAKSAGQIRAEHAALSHNRLRRIATGIKVGTLTVLAAGAGVGATLFIKDGSSVAHSESVATEIVDDFANVKAGRADLPYLTTPIAQGPAQEATYTVANVPVIQVGNDEYMITPANRLPELEIAEEPVGAIMDQVNITKIGTTQSIAADKIARAHLDLGNGEFVNVGDPTEVVHLDQTAPVSNP